MSKPNKLFRWVNGLVHKSQPTRYCTFSDMSSDEDLYEDIENYASADEIGQESGTGEYHQYLREYFFALRDSHINRQRLTKDPNETFSDGEVHLETVVDDDGEQCDQYQFLESELKKRPRGNVCLPDRPRICVCSCETVFRRPTTPPRISNIAWDAGWVFYSGNQDMRKLARRSSERLKDALFESGGD